MATTEPPTARALSPRTVQTYARDWALFTDWCAATNQPALPAETDTVLAFLTDCPATMSTQRCRVAAIDHHHTAAGHPQPGELDQVRSAVGRPLDQPRRTPCDLVAVQAALRVLPSHGWTRGMFGRRDRCLLVLSQLAGVPYEHLAHMVVSSVQVADGAASVAIASGAISSATITVTATDDPMVCGPCAVARWLRVLDLAVTKISTSVIATAINDAERVTPESPHLCRSDKELDRATTGVPLFPPIDQWGALPFPLQPLTPHSLSRRVRDILAGDLGAHRDLLIDGEVDATARTATPVVERTVYGREDAARAWVRRRVDLEDLAGVGGRLDDVDKQVTEINRQAMALLNTETERSQIGVERDIAAYAAAVVDG